MTCIIIMFRKYIYVQMMNSSFHCKIKQKKKEQGFSNSGLESGKRWVVQSAAKYEFQ